MSGLPWPFSPAGSVYCPTPAIDDFFTPFPSRWTARYGLVKVIMPPAMNLSSIAIGSREGRHWGDVAYHPPPLGTDAPNTSSTTATPFLLPTLVDAHFCSFGYTFILEAVTGYFLAALALVCCIVIAVRTRHHNNRKLLFFLLFTVGLTRGLFGHLGANRIAQVSAYIDMNVYIDWFFNWTIPLNMLGDLLMSYLDFLLTFFWLQFIAPRWSRSHWGTFVPIACVVLTALIALLVFITDYHALHGTDADYNGGNIYARSLTYISSLLLFSSLLHSIVVARLLRDLITQHAALQEISPKMRRNMVAVGMIGFISVLSGIVRGVVLLGHVSRSSAFLDGKFSFDNPVFFTVYLIGFMNTPCLAICGAFFVLSWKLMTSGESSSGIGGGDDGGSDDGVYSVISDTEGVRVSLMCGRYAYRMNSNGFGSRVGDVGHSFASSTASYGMANSSLSAPSTNSEVLGDYGGGDQQDAPPGTAAAVPLSSSSRSNRAIVSTAAMFSARGPGAPFIVNSSATGGSSRSKRHLDEKAPPSRFQ